MKADFTGYATKANLRCSDGRTILADAFAKQHDQIVPLVWQHGHDDPTNVLGHVRLENVADGVRAHAYFNATEKGKHAKEMVKHGDVRFLSIFANELLEKSKQVMHGKIREVSLVIGGANPGATIDFPSVAHSDGSVETYEDEAVITTGLELEVPESSLAHAAGDDKENERTLQDVLDSLTPEQTDAVNFLITQALHADSKKEPVKHSEELEESDVVEGETLEHVMSTLDETQSAAVYFLIDQALAAEGNLSHSDDTADVVADAEDNSEANAEENSESNAEENSEADAEETSEENVEDNSEADAEENSEAVTDAKADNAEAASTDTVSGDAVQHDNINQEDSMTHNVFDQSRGAGAGTKQVALSHSDIKNIMETAEEVGSLKKAVEGYLKHTGITVDGELKHGIENIDYLFPDAQLVAGQPAILARRMEWVAKVLDGVRKTPFARIKSVSADLTMDKARAKGYIKGNMKEEQFFKLSRRETTPQTVYKKQKLDRDDVIDITDLDVVAWMKGELKVMLDEELAAAILIGDGRSNADDDKIREDKIRPIASDDELHTTTVWVNLDDADSTIEELVDAAIANRKHYRGTGAPTFFTNEDTISAFLSVKDGFGHRLYKTLDDVKTVLRVSDIIPVEAFDRVPEIVGIMVNLVDYSLGADRGGQATMFDDFDINFNKLLYLLETRVSGALTVPKSALVFRKTAGTNVLVDPQDPTFDGTTVTVPTQTGVVYKDGAGTTMTTGSPRSLAVDETLEVFATPAAGYYFATNADDQWSFTREA